MNMQFFTKFTLYSLLLILCQCESSPQKLFWIDPPKGERNDFLFMAESTNVAKLPTDSLEYYLTSKEIIERDSFIFKKFGKIYENELFSLQILLKTKEDSARDYTFVLRTLHPQGGIIDSYDLAIWRYEEQQFCYGYVTEQLEVIRTCENNTKTHLQILPNGKIVPFPSNVESELSIEALPVPKELIFSNKLLKYNIQTQADSTRSYSNAKSQIQQLRTHILQSNLPQDSIAQLFTEALLNQIIPHWYGTQWSFEGHTTEPQKGRIACGYFVSTTLKDMGLNINRYHMAQQAPLQEALTLSFGNSVIEIENPTTEANIQAIRTTLKQGIYFMGFGDNHVGYILKKGQDLFLIHSNFMHSMGVCIELIEDSVIIPMFQKFYFVEISTNQALLEKWLKGQYIEVIKG